MISVLIHAEGEREVPNDLLERGLREVFRSEGVEEGEISLAFLGDSGVEALNRDYFQKSGPTDVIAFSLHGPGEPPLGDIYVGYDQAARQAASLDLPLEEELLRLAVHGALHVLGYTHPEAEDREESPMFLLQEELLTRILSSGTADTLGDPR